MVDIVTLDEAKRVAPQAPTQEAPDYEADLAGLVAAVSLHLQRAYGAPMPGTKTVKVWQQGGTVILPLGATVTAVTSGAIALTGWEHNAEAGLLHGVYSYGQVEVTYTVPVLPDVREAALLVIKHAWNSRTGALVTEYGAVTDERYAANPSGYFVPNRAKELLAPYGTRVA
ncbi:MAG: hypothetical protein JWO69_1999 [Thermoleophilia bacterium]|nr:hypothetical protein [Thermoleophilia bacterium]